SELQLMAAPQPDQRVLDLPVELLRVDRQERRSTGNARQVRNIEVRQARREFRDVDAANAERVRCVRAEVGLKRERHCLGVAGAQLVDETRRQNPRVVERGAVRGEPRVLNAGDEWAEVEAGRRVRRRGQAAGSLSLWSVELEL